MKYILTKDITKSAKKVELKDCITGLAANVKTMFSATYSSLGINFYFECLGECGGLKERQNGENLLDKHAVKVFLSPDGNLSKYVAIEVAPPKNVLQLGVENYDFDGAIKTYTLKQESVNANIEITQTGWHCTFFVPFSLIGSSNITRVWKFNAFRVSKISANAFEYHALSPTYNSKFHRPMYFADLVFEK